MIVYKDLITGDEMFTDTYTFREVDDFFYEVDGKTVTWTSDDANIDIGANPSAEGGGDEASEASSKSGCNIVLANKLEQTQFDKKSYQTYIKDYMKALKAKIEDSKGKEAAEDFMKRAQVAVKKVLGNFKNYDFFIGESGNPDGLVALLDFREDGITPYMLFMKDGIVSEKY